MDGALLWLSNDILKWFGKVNHWLIFGEFDGKEVRI